MPTKSRKYLVFNDQWSQGLPGYSVTSGTRTATNSELVTSTGHPYQRLGLTHEDLGGYFLSDKTQYLINSQRKNLTKPKAGWADPMFYRGMPVPIDPAVAAAPAMPAIDTLALNAMGTTAISRTLPTNPNASLGQFLGELRRDGLPSIIGSGLLKTRLKDYRELGSEYLNIQFAWKPFVSDLLKFADSVKRSEEILRQYRANSGLALKRRYDFPVIEERYAEPDVLNAQLQPNGSIAGSYPFFKNGVGVGIRRADVHKKTERWFEGAFIYYLPLGDSQLNAISRCASEANKLFGVRLTPELLYDLTPWTWAMDWVGNIGDILHNVSAFTQDGLVMQYGYMMEHSVYTRHYKLTGVAFEDGASDFNLTVIRDRKVRIPATPYGFGLSWSGFSPNQWAILAALGISNGRKTGY